MTSKPNYPEAVERVDTAELRKLLESVALLPWVADNNEGFSPWNIWSRMTPTGNGKPGPLIAQVVGDSAEADAAAALIVAAVNALPAFLNAKEAAEGEVAKLRELNNDGWFDEIAEFLDDYQDAEIIDGTTHPNKAMRLLCKLKELGL